MKAVRLEASDSRPDTPDRRKGGTSRWSRTGKRVVDLVVGSLLLVATAPLIGVVMLLTRLTSRGPALFSQVRVGINGGVFTMYKVRTMVHDCERLTGPKWSTGVDPRVTRLGRFLRRTHLDELPQLWNIVRGDMSLVGPRPERPEFVAQLERVIPLYPDRHRALPGLTGLAQVNLPPDSDLNSVRHKLVFDLYYIQQMSFSLDLRLLLCTSLFLAGVPFSVSRRLLRVPIRTTVEGTCRSLVAEIETLPHMQPA